MSALTLLRDLGLFDYRTALRELEKTGSLSLARFYSRRAKRLLPLTVVMLGRSLVVGCGRGSIRSVWRVSLGVVASGLYIVNWLLLQGPVTSTGWANERVRSTLDAYCRGAVLPLWPAPTPGRHVVVPAG